MGLNLICAGCKQSFVAIETGDFQPTLCPACAGTRIEVPPAKPVAGVNAFAPTEQGDELLPMAAALPVDPADEHTIIPFIDAPHETSPMAATAIDPPSPARAENAASARTRRRKQKGKKSRGEPVTISLFGYDFRPLTLLGLLAALVGGLFLLRWWWIADPKPIARAVDVYLAVNNVPNPADFVPGANAGPNNFFDGQPRELRKLVVTRENPQGKHLFVAIHIKQKRLDDYFGNKVMIAQISKGEINLDTGAGEPLGPLFLIDEPLPVKGEAIHYPRLRDDEDDRAARSLNVALGPPGDSPWQHEGKLAPVDVDRAQFLGANGMEIDFLKSGLPNPTLTVVWDARSKGWYATSRVPNPGNVLGGWDIKCLFTRPKEAGTLTLKVLGESFSLSPD